VGSAVFYASELVGSSPPPNPTEAGFEIYFDFIHHKLIIQTSHATSRTLSLAPARRRLHREFMETLPL
jgi:hypothetical protein